MKAVFHCKLSQQIRSIFAVGFLLLCLLGTHWLGFSHGITHAGLATASQSLGTASQSCDENHLLTHNSSSCHLFDALTLASFVSPDAQVLLTQTAYTESFLVLAATAHSPAIESPYQSQAPPRLIL